MTEAGQDEAIGGVEDKPDQIIKDMDRARDDRNSSTKNRKRLIER